MPLVNFLGCPASGKTTTAARLFAFLKTRGTPAEFVSEQARIFICLRRAELGLVPADGLGLSDKDQLNILESQVRLESAMVQSTGGDSWVISDSSPINTLFYLSQTARQSAVPYIEQALKIPTIYFYASPIPIVNQLDPNRIHDDKQIRAVVEAIPEVLKEFAPSILVHDLNGDPFERYQQVIDVVQGKF